MTEQYLNIDRLTVGYNNSPLIHEICLSVKRGEILVLIGPNGAGKSTILKSLIRQLNPLGGTVTLDGIDLAALKSNERAKRIASVFPGRVPVELLTVEDVIAMGRYPYTGTLGLLSEHDREVIRETMKQLSVEDLASRDFNQLSDGQRQRVLLARALVQEPELLVMDEPTTYLDIRYQLELLTILRKLAAERKLTIVVSLHELELAKRLADHVVCVRGDRIAAFGTPAEIFVPERIEALFDLEPGAYRRFLGQASEEANTRYILSGGKKLRCGFTTGTCAALAAQACARRLITGSWPAYVSIRTPKGWTVRSEPEDRSFENDTARCAIRKDAGDDDDRTDGMLIYASVRLTDTPGITIDGGEGIGRVTKPGLDQPVGAAAINSVPRKMIRESVESVMQSADDAGGADIVISAPEGAAVAARTFNPMLGIEGGISILGTSGIVEPMSMQALVDTIEVELRQARAQGFDTVVLTPGNYGLDWLRGHDIQPPEVPVVRCSNFIGDALDLCAAMGFTTVLLVGHVGKLVKLAGGIMNTHSRYADCRTELFCAYAALHGADAELCRALMNCATTDGCVDLLEKNGLRDAVLGNLTEAIQQHLNRRAEGKFRVGALIFSNVYGELGRTSTADEIIRAWKGA